MKSETRSFYEAAVQRAALRIVRSLDEALDLTALARQAALSPFHFHRIFRGMLGETPLEMHRRLRLERAASLLLAGSASVTTIAFDAGYETHEAFTRAFRTAYGVSPSAFRKEAGEEAGSAPFPPLAIACASGIHVGGERPTILFTSTEERSTMNVTVEAMPELRLATVHHVGAYNRIAEAFARLGSLAEPAGLLLPGSMMLAVYHDDPDSTPVEQLQSDAAITVPEDVPLPDGLVEKRIPAGSYARTMHAGPYTTLGDTWARFMGEWLPRSDRRVGAGPSYEVYRNNPSNARPEDLRTELFLPVA